MRIRGEGDKLEGRTPNVSVVAVGAVAKLAVGGNSGDTVLNCGAQPGELGIVSPELPLSGSSPKNHAPSEMSPDSPIRLDPPPGSAISLGKPAWMCVFGCVVGELSKITPVGVHGVDLGVSIAI